MDVSDHIFQGFRERRPVEICRRPAFTRWFHSSNQHEYRFMLARLRIGIARRRHVAVIVDHTPVTTRAGSRSKRLNEMTVRHTGLRFDGGTLSITEHNSQALLNDPARRAASLIDQIVEIRALPAAERATRLAEIDAAPRAFWAIIDELSQ